MNVVDFANFTANLAQNLIKKYLISTSEKGVEFLTKLEGIIAKNINGEVYAVAYKDVANIWTIGYGHAREIDGVLIKAGDKITMEKAVDLLREDLQTVEYHIKRSVKVELNQHQFDALVSIAFNIGMTAFKSSSFLKELNKGNYEKCGDLMLNWKNATINGIKKPVLLSRRKKERALFLNGRY